MMWVPDPGLIFRSFCQELTLNSTIIYGQYLSAGCLLPITHNYYEAALKILQTQ